MNRTGDAIQKSRMSNFTYGDAWIDYVIVSAEAADQALVTELALKGWAYRELIEWMTEDGKSDRITAEAMGKMEISAKSLSRSAIQSCNARSISQSIRFAAR